MSSTVEVINVSIPLSALPNYGSAMTILFSMFMNGSSFTDMSNSISALGFTNDRGIGIIPFPVSRIARVSPPDHSVVILRVREPDPIPYTMLFDFVGHSGALFALSTTVPIPMSIA